MRSHQPYVTILEQPAPKSLRFRYECEGRSAGSILGEKSTEEHKTCPTIQVMNYSGRAIVVVSCVTKNEPYRPHPYNLVGREGCNKGVCKLRIQKNMKMELSNLGIQCVKKCDIEGALRVREEIRVDPFKTGFNHRNVRSSYDLGTVRLCFQVFLEGSTKGKFNVPLPPVVSNTIFDKKSTYDLIIHKLSHCNAPCDGGQEMILLCEKVLKDDIEVRFFEAIKGGWEAFGEFKPTDVHKQVAIFFRTPRYRDTIINEPVKLKLQLRRRSDAKTSESLDFEMLPLHKVPIVSRQRVRKSNPQQRNTTTYNQQQHFEPHNQHNQALPNFQQAFSSVSCLPNVAHQEHPHVEDFLLPSTSNQGVIYTEDGWNYQPHSMQQSNFSQIDDLNEIQISLSDFETNLDDEVNFLINELNNLCSVADVHDSNVQKEESTKNSTIAVDACRESSPSEEDEEEEKIE